TVYPGHGAPEATPAAIDEDIQYLGAAADIFRTAASADAAIAQLKQKFAYTGGGLLDYSTKIYFSTCKQP
ncbi:MAG TPA: hypothetical protein PKL17_14250, partial [Pseudomonadota bacterium]|nr:hypothetical protein [Pseudomonadota bacterium]